MVHTPSPYVDVEKPARAQASRTGTPHFDPSPEHMGAPISTMPGYGKMAEMLEIQHLVCGATTDDTRSSSSYRRPGPAGPPGGPASGESLNLNSDAGVVALCLWTIKSSRRRLMIKSWLEEAHYEDRIVGAGARDYHTPTRRIISFLTTTTATLRPRQLPRPACGGKVV